MKEIFYKSSLEFGTLGIMVNNAGIERNAPSLEMKIDQWKEVISVKLSG